MEQNNILKPDYIFEVSWEACNKIGGIHTVLSSKARILSETYKDNYIVIGPDLRQESQRNGEFTEIPSLFRAWQLHAKAQGLNFRIGRWNVPGSPITILVDFTTYFGKRDEIFAHFWEAYKLDSISGQWDYVEPVMFGYAAGKIIENFYRFNLLNRDRIVAHFHHWMAGSGILYLKEHLPEAATVFTIHGTTIANTYAESGHELYNNMPQLDAFAIASEYGVTSKLSLEYNAAQNADILTCVGDITVSECEYFLKRKPEFITYNGFDGHGMNTEELSNKRDEAREILFNVAESVLNTPIDRNTTIVAHSGRNQMRNKGIDMFIDALNAVNSSDDTTGSFLAFVIVPALHTGPRYEVGQRLTQKDFALPVENEFLTHVLHNEDADGVMLKIKTSSLKNSANCKVKIIVVPCYLDGNDGILNKHYYDIMHGFDLTIFPSYYEPWGYTPTESLTYGIPTVTTNLTGFGLWLRNTMTLHTDSIYIAERDDKSYNNTMLNISKFVKNFNTISGEDIARLKAEAMALSAAWRWDNQIKYYYNAFSASLSILELRMPDILKNRPVTEPIATKSYEKPHEWRKIFVKTFIPDKLFNLMRISKNLWWSWNRDAQELFASLNRNLWETVGKNPIALLNNMSLEEFQTLENNEDFLRKLSEVSAQFDAYMNKPKSDDRSIAYFSMEFGIHDSLKIFSGGLGVLAGDYLKEASDAGKNIAGMGLLYRYGYFQQRITLHGEQISEKVPQKFTDMPVQPVRDNHNEWVKISLSLPGRTLYAKVWKAEVGRINLYLLDTDIDENSTADRAITHQLYGGNNEMRLLQEILLGIGGVKTYEAIGLKPMLFHCNEGHAAFSSLERLRGYIQNEKFTFDEALESVRSTTLFTTHTPVPAGHDFFSEELLRTYLPHYAERLNISWENFMNLGRMTEDDASELFSMSVLAVRTSQEVNAVSRIHGRVSQEMFNKMWKAYFPDELHIGYVTNGVHYPTWVSPLWHKLHRETFGADFDNNQHNFELWQKIHQVPDETIWSIRQTQRKILMDDIKIRIMQNMTSRQENPKLIFEIIDAINDNALTIGFARRFATYKRAHLLFSNLEKLSALLNNPERPLMFIYAGKAHPADIQGQDLIKRIIEVSKMKDFIGKVVFIENYDMELASKLVQGVDIWLNTPTRPLEASGTSGEKAVMNGVMNLSVLDGWWAEGYKPGAGWALKEERTYIKQNIQDELDAETIYIMLKDEIVPLFYNRSEDDIPSDWIKHIKNTISEVAPNFTMNRMINDYYSKFYNKLFDRSNMLKTDNFQQLKELTSWKLRFIRAWENIEIMAMKVPDSTNKPLKLGEKFAAEVELDLGPIAPENIGIEIMFGQKEMDVVRKAFFKQELDVKHIDGQKATFGCDIFVTRAGVFDYALRMFVKHPLLPHRQDFNLVRWL